MLKELHDRINKIKTELDNITKLPEIIAVKKGQIMQNTSNTENEKTIVTKKLLEEEVVDSLEEDEEVENNGFI